MTLAEVLAQLLDLVGTTSPSAADIEDHFSAMSTALQLAGPNFERPPWATSVSGKSDVYLSLAGDVRGIHIWEDSRGWGAYASVVVSRGTLADVESVVGPTRPMPRAPDDFHSGEKAAAYVEREGKTVRVFTELTRDRTGVQGVTVSFPSRGAA
jgi:hypothetical protein